MERAKPTRNRLTGFTLIEMIGVASVAAILMAVATPVVTKRIDQAARDAEGTSLSEMAEALVQSSLKARQIPAAADFPVAIAGYLDVHTNQVRINKRSLNRVFLAHPSISPALPYTQTTNGTSYPTNARLMLIGSVAKALVMPANTAANFDDIWNTPKNTVPTSMTAWGGRGEDLIIQRIELAPYFHKLLLANVDPAPLIGRFAVDSTVTVWTNAVLPWVSNSPNNRFASYFMHGTVVDFYRSDSTLDYPATIYEDTSYVYQNNRWGRQLYIDEDEIGDFGQLVDRFLQQPVPCDPDFGATQRSVVNAFYDYLWGYADWAFGDPAAVPTIPPFAGAGGNFTPQYPSYSVANNAATHLSGGAAFTDNLIQ
jgi:Tfp pilus assembly protein PilE